MLPPPAATAAPQEQQQQQPALHSRPAANGLHIVRFRQYRMAAEHHAALAAALPGAAAGWEWVERRNKAAAYPTDFGLVRLAAGAEAAFKVRPQAAALPAFLAERSLWCWTAAVLLACCCRWRLLLLLPSRVLPRPILLLLVLHPPLEQERLGSLRFVRDVHPERVLTRGLMAASAEAVAAAQHAQFAPCQQGGEAGLCIAKRPGRLTTRPTFSLEDNQEEEGEEAAPGGAQQQRGGRPAGGQRVANDTVAGGGGGGGRRRRARQRGLLQATNLATVLQADAVWAQGFRGQGVKMGVFDTGIKGDHPDVKHIV